jgi:hypothetical protein
MSAMSEATRSPAVDGGETAGPFASHPRLAGEHRTVEEFIAHVLHRARPRTVRASPGASDAWAA